jgi:hypothetical protein
LTVKRADSPASSSFVKLAPRSGSHGFGRWHLRPGPSPEIPADPPRAYLLSQLQISQKHMAKTTSTQVELAQNVNLLSNIFSFILIHSSVFNLYVFFLCARTACIGTSTFTTTPPPARVARRTRDSEPSACCRWWSLPQLPIIDNFRICFKLFDIELY